MRLATILFVVAIAVWSGSPAWAADGAKTATGTWEWSYKTRDGKDARVCVKLKQDGEKLTGAFVERAGSEVPIADGKIDAGGKLSFDVTRTINNEERLFKYRGQLEGDTITGKIDFIKDGKAFPHDWEARRVVEKPKE